LHFWLLGVGTCGGASGSLAEERRQVAVHETYEKKDADDKSRD
jgi:hypothetical protein